MNPEIKLTILKAFKFIIIIIAIDFCFGFFTKELFFSQTTGKFKRVTYAIRDANEDVIIFGSSHAHRHYVPEVIEKRISKTCYNAGADGQQLLFHRAMQKMIFKRNLPKIIILNIDENFLFKSEAAYNRLTDLNPYYAGYRNELKPILNLNSSAIDLKLFFNSYKTNSTLMHAIKYYIKPQIDYKGYRPLFGEMTVDKIEEYKKSKLEDEFIEFIDTNFVDALKDFIDDAQENKVKVVFVTSPNLMPRDTSKNESFQKIKEIAKLKKVLFIDFSNSPKFINKLDLFHDITHLNNKGATLFSASVANLIGNE